MHDRRIDGEAVVFGNAGGLFMSAMTWFDHSTRSIWSQPWGRAILGPLRNVELRLLPSQISSWAAWEAAYPNSLVMVNDLENANRGSEDFPANLIIGAELAGERSAFYIADVIAAGIVNITLSDEPVLLWAVEGDYRTYLRRVADEILTFQMDGDEISDVETDSTWDLRRGLARSGPLAGEALQQIPSSTAYDWAWLDFYPDSDILSIDSTTKSTEGQ